jgi:Skp family chaperone for outer membrane proteins
MKKSFIIAMALVIGSLSLQAKAAEDILLVNQQSVIEQSKAGKFLLKQNEDLQKDLIDRLEVFRKEIEEKDKKIEDDKTLLSPEVYQERKIALQEEANAKQQELQARGQEIQQAVQKASATIQSVMKPILEGLVDEKGAKILLDRQVVITGDPKLDISAEVVKKLNKRLLAEDLKLNISK